MVLYGLRISKNFTHDSSGRGFLSGGPERRFCAVIRGWIPCLFFAIALLAAQQSADDEIAALAAKAKAAEQAGDAAAAAQAYERILRLRPGLPQAEFNLGLMYQLQKRHIDAIRLFTAALGHDSSLAPAHLFAGISYFNTAQYDKARASLERFLKLHPSDPEVRFFLGGTYYALEDHAAAVRQYLGQLKLTPGRSEVYYHLGECYLALSRKAIKTLSDDPAGQYYLLLLSAEGHGERKDGVAPEESIRRAIAIDPTRPEAHCLSKGSSGQSPPRGCPPAVPAAGQVLSLADLERLTEEVLVAQAGAPSDPKTAWWSARSYLGLAQAALLRLDALAPGSHLIAHIRGRRLEEQGKLTEAEAEYRRAVTLNPRDPSPLIDYARLKARNDLFDEAAPMLEEALQIDPYNVTGNALLGEIHHMQSRWKEAVPRLLTALRANPRDAQTRIYLALSLRELNRIGEAVAVLEKAPPDKDGRIHYVLSQIYRSQGRTADAARALAVFQQRRKEGKPAP